MPLHRYGKMNTQTGRRIAYQLKKESAQIEAKYSTNTGLQAWRSNSLSLYQKSTIPKLAVKLTNNFQRVYVEFSVSHI